MAATKGHSGTAYLKGNWDVLGYSAADMDSETPPQISIVVLGLERPITHYGPEDVGAIILL